MRTCMSDGNRDVGQSRAGFSIYDFLSGTTVSFYAVFQKRTMMSHLDAID